MVVRIGPKKPRQRPYLKEWRKYRHLTQAQLAERMGTTEASISRYEKGRRAIPGGFLAALAEALQCQEEELFQLPPSNDEPAEPSLDEMVKEAPHELRKKIFSIVETLVKTGT